MPQTQRPAVSSYVYDPAIKGFDESFFNKVSGANPTVANGRLVFGSAAEIASYYAHRYADAEFVCKVKTAPATGHLRQFGFKTPGLGDRASIRFDIAGAVFKCKVFNDDGGVILDEAVAWDAAWTDADKNFRIVTDKSKGVKFMVGGTVIASCDRRPTIALPLYVKDTVADSSLYAPVIVREGEIG